VPTFLKGRAVTSSDEPSAPPGVASPFEDRMSRADLWEAGADERERLADERERLADEREALADERERLADRHDYLLDRRELDLPRQVTRGELTEAEAAEAEVAEARAALSRAEAAARRAEAELLRARQKAARAAARVARSATGSARATAAQQAEQTVDTEESAWLADRRDFIAAERDELAAERDTIADERDETAGLRERLADDRERIGLERERRLDERRRSDGRAGAAWVPAVQDPAQAGRRADRERLRESAAARRRAAAQERSRTSASWRPHAYGPTLVASFAQLARQLFGPEDVAGALPQVLKFTTDAVAGCDWASVTLWRHGRVIDVVSSDPVAAELDDIQFGTGIGPAAEALQSQNPVHVTDLADSPRWPVLAATAAQLGVASCLSHGLFVHQPAQWSPLGTFTLYSATPAAFSDEDQEFGSLLAAYLAVAVAMAHRREEVDHREAALHRGLSTRDVIGQAKGILMERQRLSAGDAFDLLRRASQRLNRKLVDVAEHLAETGELPE
jgi:ANTAR domain/GAF domain